MLARLIEQVLQNRSLNDNQVELAVTELADEHVPAEIKAAFLIALAQKGETTEEIAAFARALRERSVQPAIDPKVRSGGIVDVCGTGGDRLGTFNISTTVALVLAGEGVTVAKHGNRAVTSKAGSADVLEELGVPIDLGPEEAGEALRKHHFAFFFAQKYHPAFKHIAPARKICAEHGQRTIFNFLGPLLNPAQPSAQLIGVPQPALCEPIARVLQSLGVRRGMVVSGKVGEAWLDEFSTLGENSIAEFYQDRAFSTSTFSLEHFPLQTVTLADLKGGDRIANAETVRRLLNGEERGAKRDAVLLNAGAAFFVAGKSRTVLDGWALAVQVIDSGKAAEKLAELVRTKRSK